MGTVVGVIIVVLIVLFVVGKMLNSISKSVQRMQGKDRCASCKSRIKAVNGQYAAVCRKCGAHQPWADPFQQAMRSSKLVPLDSERPDYAGPVTVGGQQGTLVLTNHRLHFTPKGRNLAPWTVDLASVDAVIRITDAPGFGVRVGEQKHFFATQPGTQWYDKTLAAANAPAVQAVRTAAKAKEAGAPGTNAG